MLEGKTTEDLMRIAHAGGGMEIDVGNRTTEDIMRIANAAKTKGARLMLYGLGGRTTEELMRIGHAGEGAVVFMKPK